MGRTHLTTACCLMAFLAAGITAVNAQTDYLVVVGKNGGEEKLDLNALRKANPGQCCIKIPGGATVKSIVPAGAYYVSPPNDQNCNVKTCPSNPAGIKGDRVWVCGCKGGPCCPAYPTGPAPVPQPTTPPIVATKPAKEYIEVSKDGKRQYIDLEALRKANPGKCCLNIGAQTVFSIVPAGVNYISPPTPPGYANPCEVKTCPSNPAGIKGQSVYVCGCKGGACCPAYPTAVATTGH